MPRVFVSQWIFPEAVEQLVRAGIEVIHRDEDAPLPAAELRDHVLGFDGLICLLTDRIDRSLLAANPGLRIVANVAAGYDNVDVESATEYGIVVTNTPDVLTHATADLTFALLLAAARRLPEADQFVRSGRWERWKLIQEQTGRSVHGQTLGIVGLGRIGQAVARRAAHGFDMRVLYHQRRQLPQAEQRVVPAEFCELDELLERSDFVSLHAPATAETRHLIGADELRRIGPDGILVNTSRGALVDEAALAEALRDGTLGGAGLDVFKDEPAVHPALLELHQNVVLAPHIGSATMDARRRMSLVAAENVRAAFAGEPVPHPVNTVGEASHQRPRSVTNQRS